MHFVAVFRHYSVLSTPGVITAATTINIKYGCIPRATHQTEPTHTHQTELDAKVRHSGVSTYTVGPLCMVAMAINRTFTLFYVMFSHHFHTSSWKVWFMLHYANCKNMSCLLRIMKTRSILMLSGSWNKIIIKPELVFYLLNYIIMHVWLLTSLTPRAQ